MTEADTNETSEPPGSPGRPSAGPDGLAAAVDLADPQHRLKDGARGWLRDAIARAVLLLESGGEVRVRIVGDDEISRAHEEYLGETGTTDVITFDMSEGEEAPGGHGLEAGSTALAGVPGRHLDADLLICYDEGARQSAGRGHPVEQELLLYVVHGLLHCLGHDDHDAQAAVRMHEAEDRVLSELGVGATYSRAAASSRGASAAERADDSERETS